MIVPLSRTPSIYQIRHIESGKVYVGSAVNPRKRWNTHYYDLKNGAHHSRYLQRAWDKYGEDAFVFEILEPVLFVEDLIAREQHWIDTLRAPDPDYGYNTSSVAGSTLGVVPSDETRVKLRVAVGARPNPMSDPAIRERHRLATLVKSDTWRVRQKAGIRAYKRSDTERKRTSDMMKRRFDDPEYRANISAKNKERWQDPVWREQETARIRARSLDPKWRSAVREALADPDVKARQKAGMDRLTSDPKWQAWRAEKNRQMAKTYDGFVSPDGTVYAPVRNLNAFCKEHGLLGPLMGNVASGKQRHHHGWTRYVP